MINYRALLTATTGGTYRHLGDFLSLSATKDLTGTEDIAITMPKGSVADCLLKKDNIIQIWAGAPGRPRKLWHAYFLLGWKPFDVGSSQQLLLYGKGPNDILRRRIMAEYKGTSNTVVTDYADDVLKAVVRDAFADGIAPAPNFGTRVIPNFSVQPDLGNGPIITSDCGWENILTEDGSGILPAITAAAIGAGTPVWYRVVSVINGNTISFQFHTYTTETFLDATGQVIFDPALGTLQDGFWDTDYTNEANTIYVGGQGQLALRTIEQVGDAERYDAGIFGRTEAFVDAPEASDDALEALGYTELQRRMPIQRIGGTPINLPDAEYSYIWDIGTRVTCRYGDVIKTPVVVGTALNIQGKQQSLEMRLDYAI